MSEQSYLKAPSSANARVDIAGVEGSLEYISGNIGTEWCTLGDIIAEWSVFALPQIAVWFGWHSLFGEKIFAVWIYDYLVAFALGIAFLYFTIKPMRDVSVGEGIWAAVKAYFLSITSWQGGMYGLMALSQFAWFRPSYGAVAEGATPEFWFAMQIAMLAGFAPAFPTNWWLIRKGVKEEM